jgi:predicted O-methyltransferase YrrM
MKKIMINSPINIREFNNYVSNDKRVEQIIVPLGDGMTVCRVL